MFNNRFHQNAVTSPLTKFIYFNNMLAVINLFGNCAR